MSFNNDELVAPKWVNSDFLKEVLEFNGDLQNVKIVDYEISPGTGVGDHFASIMFRAKITYSTSAIKNQECSIIIKAMPEEEGIKKDLLTKADGPDLFGTETIMYTKILDRCSEIISRAGFKDPLAAKMMYHSKAPHTVLAFDDLKALGYFMFPGNHPDDYEASLIASKLGQFHAATFKMAAEGCEYLKFKGTLFNIHDFEEFPTFKYGINFLTDLVETLPGFEETAKKLRNIPIEKLVTKCRDRINTPGSYNVLNHGDYHIKNMMFKGEDEDSISELILVDFQLCHWGSPAYDLYYLTSVLPNERRERAYRVYFDTFTDVLLRSGCKGNIPTYEQLQQELKAYQCFDLFFLTTFICFFCVKKEEIGFQMEELATNPELIRDFYKTPTYTKFVKGVLPSFSESGLLDSLAK